MEYYERQTNGSSNETTLINILLFASFDEKKRVRKCFNGKTCEYLRLI